MDQLGSSEKLTYRTHIEINGVYYSGLAYWILEAGKSHDLPSARWSKTQVETQSGVLAP